MFVNLTHLRLQQFKQGFSATKQCLKGTYSLPSLPYNFQGFQKNIFYTKDNFKIKAVLNQTFQQNLERGFFLAYDSLLQGIVDKDYSYLYSITQNKLGKTLEDSIKQFPIELAEKEEDYEIHFTDLSLQIGDYHPDQQNQSFIQLEMLDVINLKLYGNSQQKLEVDKLTLTLECFIRSQLHLVPQEQEDDTESDQYENNFHKVVFETHSIESAKSKLNLFKLISLDKIQRLQYCHKYFLGKEYEWKIKALDC